MLEYNLLYDEVYCIKTYLNEPCQTKLDYIILIISGSPTKVRASAALAIAVNTCLDIFEGGQNMPLRQNYKIAVCLWYFQCSLSVLFLSPHLMNSFLWASINLF